MSSYKNKNNKGVALILALGVSSVLLTLGMAYVGGAIQESNLSQRYQDSMASLYEAERGVQYAVLEARNSGWQFFLFCALVLCGSIGSVVGCAGDGVRYTVCLDGVEG